MGKRVNFLTLLKEAGIIQDLALSERAIRRYVRWTKANMPGLELLNLAPGVYTVDTDLFNRELASLREHRKLLAKSKAERARALNKRIQDEKDQGLRDNRGRALEGYEDPSKKTRL